MRFHIIGFGILFIFALSACGAGSSVEPTTTLQGAIVPSRIPTDTPTATATNTLTPSVTPTATATNTPVATATPTSTNTPTATPTPLPPSYEIGEQTAYTAVDSISDAQPIVQYNFTGFEGDVVSMSVERASDFLDPFIYVLDQNGQRIAENDDIAEGDYNASINNFVLPADGEYRVFATRFRENAGPTIGAFELIFSRQAASNVDLASGISLISIEYDTNINGTIDDDTPFISYVFSGRAGETITVEMARLSGVLDPYILLFQRDTQAVLGEIDDDPRGGTRNAYLEGITLPADGDYIVLATRYQGIDGETAGDFILRVSLNSD